MMDAARQTGRHLGDGVLAVYADEIGKRREQGRIGEHLRLDAVMQRLFPSIENISERRLLLCLLFRGTQRSLG